MARVEPFKGVRPKKDLAEKVASPPYDVLNSDEAREFASGNEFSFLHIVKPEIDLPEGTDLYSDQVYDKALENFSRFIKEGTLVQDSERYFYVYQQEWMGHVQTGLVAGASAQDYIDDKIKKHELTREDKEKDRMRHIRTLNANTGPVFLTFKDEENIAELMNKCMENDPEYDFTTDDRVHHILYVVKDNGMIDAIKDAFSKTEFLYVADGHHRSASGTNIKLERENANPDHTGDEEYNFFLSVIFPHNQMKILPYNRVLKDMNGMCKAELFLKLSEKFSYEETDLKEPANNKEFCMYIDGKWYLLKAKADSYDADHPVESLDAAILQNNALDFVWGISNPRKDKRVDFVGGIRGTKELERLVDEKKFKLAFSLYPTSIEELFDVADSGNIMPPKCTWFEPKLRSGLITHLLD
ncbi:MAG: DUF1015 family protein [Acidobacteriota bacterium]